eukprot:SAG22_NODE_5287_length_1044_cov_2.275132_2_plen_112_part_00
MRAQPNIEWLDEQCKAQQLRQEEAGLNTQESWDGTLMHMGTADIVWMVVFEMVRNEKGKPTKNLTQETVEVLHALWKLDMHVEYRLSFDQNELLVLISLSRLLAAGHPMPS